eukprot:Polyplicarium_translucidae@DN4634_c0_g1_i1.p1
MTTENAVPVSRTKSSFLIACDVNWTKAPEWNDLVRGEDPKFPRVSARTHLFDGYHSARFACASDMTTAWTRLQQSRFTILTIEHWYLLFVALEGGIEDLQGSLTRDLLLKSFFRPDPLSGKGCIVAVHTEAAFKEVAHRFERHQFEVTKVDEDVVFAAFVSAAGRTESAATGGDAAAIAQNESLLVANLVGRSIKAVAGAEAERPDQVYSIRKLLELRAATKVLADASEAESALKSSLSLEIRIPCSPLLPGERPRDDPRHSSLLASHRHSSGAEPSDAEVFAVARTALEEATKRRHSEAPRSNRMPRFDVCAAEFLPVASEATPSVEEDHVAATKRNLLTLLKHVGPSGIRINQLPTEYQRRYGRSIDVASLGYESIHSLLANLAPTVSTELVE